LNGTGAMGGNGVSSLSETELKVFERAYQRQKGIKKK
jgi:hypothetical protein